MPSTPPGHSRRAVVRWLATVGTGLAVGSAAHGALYERFHLEVARARVPVPGLAPALDGLRVGLLTDTHHSLFTSAEAIGHACALLLAEAPDLILLGGDYVTQRDRRYIDGSARAMASLHAPLGVFAVLGNHDDEVRMPKALERQGITVLLDARTTLRTRGERLDLIGVRFWTRDDGSLQRLAHGASASTLLLAHDPRRLAEAEAAGIPAVFSGHTHGGQIALPLLGPVAAQKYPVPAGLLVRPSSTLFVSRGVGTVVLPCRINCPPDVAVLTLSATPAAGPARAV